MLALSISVSNPITDRPGGGLGDGEGKSASSDPVDAQGPSLRLVATR